MHNLLGILHADGVGKELLHLEIGRREEKGEEKKTMMEARHGGAQVS